jgi:hypothetical protein
LEGLFCVELARRGAEVVAVEGRRANVEKIRLAKDALGLDRLELRHEDVRSLSQERHGEFDVVLCLGVLCLLDDRDAFILLTRLHELCRDLLVVEADLATVPDATHEDRGRRYHGTFVSDRPAGAHPGSPESRWTSIGNSRSFRMTAPSLGNALADAGFALVMECTIPALSYARAGTVTYVALQRAPTEIVSVPTLVGQREPRLPERPVPLTAVLARQVRPLARRVVPDALRPAAGRLVTKILGSS